jgi:molybdopterin/thiamine biosynthesis adenylyltransferase
MISEARPKHDFGSAPCADLPGLWALVSACYVTGAALSLALSQEPLFGSPDPMHVEFEQLGLIDQNLNRPLDLGVAYMAGAGAIGNGFLWAARHVEIAGTLHVVDDDQVSSGNLNRQVWFGTADIDKFKAARLVELAQPHLRGLNLKPRVARLQDLPERSEGPWLNKLLVAVDSRRARRALQNEFPGEVFDASTTDIREIVVHHNRQVTDFACMSCIYEPDQEEASREAHIAGHFGVSVDEVRSERISEEAARVISGRFPTLETATLVGTAYDSLFKRLCAEAALKTSEGKRVLAPFAFVSVLAGSLLLIEMFTQASPHPARTNYWRLSPWHPPLVRRRVLRPRQPDCAFCSNQIMATVNRDLWGVAGSAE